MIPRDALNFRECVEYAALPSERGSRDHIYRTRLADASAVKSPPVYLSGLQARFHLPVMDGAGYSPAYLEFMRKVVHLRTLAVAEEAIRELWVIEMKLLQLLHVDSTGSPTWFLDACGLSGSQRQRLLLSNYNLGVSVHARSLQLGLNFTEAGRELFGGAEMGEDALRVLQDYRRLHRRIAKEIAAELPQIRAAAAWAKSRRASSGAKAKQPVPRES